MYTNWPFRAKTNIHTTRMSEFMENNVSVRTVKGDSPYAES